VDSNFSFEAMLIGAADKRAPKRIQPRRQTMKLSTAYLAALVTLASATSLHAEPVTAKLQNPLTGASKPVAGGAIFECLGDVCAARAPSSDTATLHGCKELVRQIDPVTTYGRVSKPFAPERIATYNA